MRNFEKKTKPQRNVNKRAEFHETEKQRNLTRQQMQSAKNDQRLAGWES